MIKLSSIQLNPANPRIIRDDKFEQLKASIEQFPKMMELRPIVVDNTGMVLGGNMRLRALQDLGYKEVPPEWVRQADDLTEDEKRRFIITDNEGFGQCDWDILANEWDAAELVEWGLDVPDWGNQDFSERNQEIDTDDLNEKMIIKLEYVFEEYNKVKEKLHEIADTPEQAVWKLLGLE